MGTLDKEATAIPDFNIGGVRILVDYPVARALEELLKREAHEKQDQGWGDLARRIDISCQAIEAEGMEEFDV